MSVFLLTPLLSTIKLCGSNVLKVIPIQVSEFQYLFHERRETKGVRDYWDPSYFA